jgi:hypothetical protein
MSIPKVVVKKEPVSPEQAATTKHKPRHLDLTQNNLRNIGNGPLSGRPMTAREPGSLGMQDVLSACLSPGFNTSDPAVQQQLQRSMSVRDQQRLIIEARQKGHKPTGDGEAAKNASDALFKPNRNTSRRKGPPPMLSINAPNASQFANERVIQSAPLGASFTGLRHHPDAPLLRQVVNQPSNLSHSSHIHHVPAIQTSNRLPPIADVFPGELTSNRSNFNLSPGNSHNAPLPSPGYPPSFAQAHSKSQHSSQAGASHQSLPSRREFKNADEAVRSLTGGREDLLPRLVHYGGHQPPTPPSPAPHKSHGLGVSSGASSAEQQTLPMHRPSLSTLQSGGSRRRDRDEYEKDNGSPPLGRGPASRRAPPNPFTGGFRDSPRDSPETNAAKKKRFLEIVEEAWDLFHS